MPNVNRVSLMVNMNIDQKNKNIFVMTYTICKVDWMGY